VWRLTDVTSSEDNLPIEFVSSFTLEGEEQEQGPLGKPLEISWWTRGGGGGKLLVGTSLGCVCVVSGLNDVEEETTSGNQAASSSTTSVTVVTDGRGGKARKISTHPSEQLFLSLTSDKILSLWDLRTRGCERVLGSTQISNVATSVCWCPDGKVLAVGTEAGEVMVYSCTFSDCNTLNTGENDFVDWEVLLRRSVAAKSSGIGKSDAIAGRQKGSKSVDGGNNSKDAGSASNHVTELKYSPSGDQLAVGTKNGLIHILSTQVLSSPPLFTAHSYF